MFWKKAKQSLLQKGAGVLAACAWAFALLAANSACCIPFYEPAQPEEIEMLKKLY